MARLIVFTDSGFWKYSWAHLVMSMTESCRWVMQCRLRARRPRASNKDLRPCPLRTEISPVPLNLLMILCTVDDEICKAFAILRWGTLFLKYSTIFLRTLSQIGEPKAYSKASSRRTFAQNFRVQCEKPSRHPVIANHVTDLMSINLISW